MVRRHSEQRSHFLSEPQGFPHQARGQPHLDSLRIMPSSRHRSTPCTCGSTVVHYRRTSRHCLLRFVIPDAVAAVNGSNVMAPQQPVLEAASSPIPPATVPAPRDPIVITANVVAGPLAETEPQQAAVVAIEISPSLAAVTVCPCSQAADVF